jgi:type II secretory ATPase GspE/PulE/Tfp pilus assembly ATPase PilB-like protein
MALPLGLIPASSLLAVETGGYVSIWKAVLVFVVLLAWARVLTWADKDAVAAHLPRTALNIANLCGMVLGFVLFFMIPGFMLAFLVLLLVFLAEVGTYLVLRHNKVGLHDLQGQFQAWLKTFKRKKVLKDEPGQIRVMTKGGTAVTAPEQDSLERPAYDAMVYALSDPLKKGAEQIDLAPGPTGVQVKFMVDGMQYTGPVIEGTAGAGAITMLKGAAGLDVNEKRKPQVGQLKGSMEGQRQDLKLQTAGSTAGEFARIIVNPKERHGLHLEQLGMTEKQIATMKELIKDLPGLVLLAAPKDQGLTSLNYGVLRAHDAFLTHIHTIEREPDQDLEGITQNKLAPNAPPAEEAKVASWVISQEPDVILIDKVEDQRTAADLLKYAKEKRAYVGIRASNASDAIEQWRRLVGSTEQALEPLRLVIATRVVRKLCTACKIAYAPDPNTLRKLGLSPEKVTTLYQAREQPLRDPKGRPIPCEFCHDLRFKGRTGIYEFFPVDDEMRDSLKKDFTAAGKPHSQTRATFRKQRGKYLQEEALGLVEKGETSVPEVKRVLTMGGEESPRSSQGAPAGAGAPVAAGAPARAPARPPARRST